MKEAIIKAAEEYKAVLATAKKVAIIFDDDPDGICSAGLLSKHLGPTHSISGFSTSKVDLLGPDAEKTFKNFDCIIITDVVIENQYNLEALEQWFIEQKKTLVYFDHHKHEQKVPFGLQIHAAEIQDKVPIDRYCCSKLVFDILIYLEPEMKRFAWMASIGVIGDCAHDVWKKVILYALSVENEKIHDSDKLYDIPSTPDKFRSCVFGKASDLIFLGDTKGDSVQMFYSLFKAEDFTNFYKFLQQYKPIAEEIKDYVENLTYMLQNTPKKDPNELQIFEVEVKSQYNILRASMNKMAEAEPTVLVIGYATRGDTARILTRYGAKTMDLVTIFIKTANLLKNPDKLTHGGSPVGAGATMPKDMLKTFKNKLYEVLAEN